MSTHTEKNLTQRGADPNILKLTMLLGEHSGQMKSLIRQNEEVKKDMASLSSKIGAQCESCGPAKDLKTQKKIGYALLIAVLLSIVKDFKPTGLIAAVKAAFGWT